MGFKEFVWEIHDRYSSDEMSLYEMTNLSKRQTGLEYNVFVSGKGGAKHGPRVKVSNKHGKFDFDDSFSLSVDHEPKHRSGTIRIPGEHVEAIKDWIRLNHDHLHKMWKSDTMDSEDHKDGLQKLGA